MFLNTIERCSVSLSIFCVIVFHSSMDRVCAWSFLVSSCISIFLSDMNVVVILCSWFGGSVFGNLVLVSFSWICFLAMRVLFGMFSCMG